MTTKSDFDLLQRFMFNRCDIRGELVCLRKSFQEACAHQLLDSTKMSLLGEFLAATALLGDSLKFDGVLTLQARGDGKIPLIMADATYKNHVRGIVKSNHSTIPDSEASLPALLGNAVLSITIDPDKGERYQGIVPLEKETLAQCLNDYFSQSEQLPSHFILFANTDACAGLFLQAMPSKINNDPETTNDYWQSAIQLANTLSLDELCSIDNETILYRLFHELECSVFPPTPISFSCGCTEERSSNAIAALGKTDAYQLLEESNPIEINCEFCGKQYCFDKQKLTGLFRNTH